MDVNQAFSVLVQATGQINANRETHVAIQQALDVVKSALAGNVVTEPVKEEPQAEQNQEIDNATEDQV